jgi:hypothetical protein
MATSATISASGRKIDAVPGSRKTVYRDITFSTTYPTGGEALPSAASLGLKEILFVDVECSAARNAAGTSAVPVAYDRTNHKLQAYVSNGASPALLAEAPSLTNLSAFTARVRFEGYIAS